MIRDKMRLILKKETKKVHLFLKGLELLCIIGQNLYKSDSGSKRACKKAEGLSSWMMDAVESATGSDGPRDSLLPASKSSPGPFLLPVLLKIAEEAVYLRHFAIGRGKQFCLRF